MQTKTAKQPVKQHLNLPQLYFSLVFAQVTALIWGRATGKSEGPGAIFTVKNIHDMPRSNGFIMGKSYVQLLTKTVSPLMTGWEKLGYYENIHYFIRKYPPLKLRLPKAYKHPVSPEHYISWYNGTGLHLASQDRPGTMNGLRTQFGLIDEARLINKKRFNEEVIPTLAGHADKFGHLSNYLSLLFASDMPRTSAEKWLFDFKEEMDSKTIELILAVQIQLIKLHESMANASPSTITRTAREMTKLQGYLNELRKGTVYFSMASALDNIHALGIDAIRNWKRQLPDLEFQISILNKQIIKAEHGFYGYLDPEVHGYTAADYAYIDALDLDYRNPAKQDCRWDADIYKSLPLEIACDYNNAINSIVTGQEHSNTFRLLSSKYVLHPQLLGDCVELWHEYYKYHPVKEVNYWFDATAVKGDARTDISFADEWTQALTRKGWKVNRMDIGQIGSHGSRYYFWGRLLQGQDPDLPRFRYNRDNCAAWEISAQQAGILKKQDKIQKDKSSEKRGSGIPPQEATHLSEAGDVLLWGRYRDRIQQHSDYVPMATS